MGAVAMRVGEEGFEGRGGGGERKGGLVGVNGRGAGEYTEPAVGRYRVAELGAVDGVGVRVPICRKVGGEGGGERVANRRASEENGTAEVVGGGECGDSGEGCVEPSCRCAGFVVGAEPIDSSE